MNPSHKTYQRKFILLLIIASFISWLPILLVSFINDDYQIIGYHLGGGFSSLLKPFYMRDVSYYYWRPLGNLLHPLIILIGGFNPFPFRFVSLILYTICGITIFKAGKFFSLSENFSFLTALFFLVLPSHEYQVAWIADQGEIMVLICLLLAFIFYSQAIQNENYNIKKSIYAALWITAALLIKEVAFTGIFIPAIAFLLIRHKTKEKLKIISRDSFIALLIICLLLLYRYLVIGGTPFEAKQIHNGNILQWIINFIIYIPLVFVSPEFLRNSYLFFYNNLFLSVLIFLIILSLSIFLIKGNLEYIKKNRLILSASILWFIVFIIPVITALMRWYVFTASIGIIWFIGIIMEKSYLAAKFKKVYAITFSILILIFIIIDFNMMLKWKKAGGKMDKAVVSIENLKNQINSDTLIVFAVPNKFDEIPLMKLGVQQTFQYALGNKNVEVVSPLRSEIENSGSKIYLSNSNDSILYFKMNRGKFLPFGFKDYGISKNMNVISNVDGYKIHVNDFYKKGELRSQADVKINLNIKQSNFVYYNGNEFKIIK